MPEAFFLGSFVEDAKATGRSESSENAILKATDGHRSV